MKITKRQLKRIIKEERAKLIEQSRVGREARLLADLNDIATAIEEIARGMYGLVDPGEPRGNAGDEMAADLEMQIERMNEVYRRLEAHLESMDPEFDPDAPGMR
jgi:hypothetical protein